MPIITSVRTILSINKKSPKMSAGTVRENKKIETTHLKFSGMFHVHPGQVKAMNVAKTAAETVMFS